MKPITLSEFQKLSGLPDKAIVWLLSNKKLTCSIDKNNELLIDTSGIEITNLIQSLTSSAADAITARQALIEERIGALMSQKLEEMIEMVLTRLESD